MSLEQNQRLYLAISSSLKQSYPSVTPEKVADVHKAMLAGEPIPYGIVGMFAQHALKEATQ